MLNYVIIVPEKEREPCKPSPCGPNSQCTNNNGQAVCSCLPQFIGTPPNCRPECLVNSECGPNRACVNQKCVDPCVGTCGRDAQCKVVHHSPICVCANGFTGDPFVYCFANPSMFYNYYTLIQSSQKFVFFFFVIKFLKEI